jgi:hypothetical protein
MSASLGRVCVLVASGWVEEGSNTGNLADCGRRAPRTCTHWLVDPTCWTLVPTIVICGLGGDGSVGYIPCEGLRRRDVKHPQCTLRVRRI